MIPGSGEFVYDTEIQYKTLGSSYGDIISHEAYPIIIIIFQIAYLALISYKTPVLTLNG